MTRIETCLWMDDQAEDAAAFYVDVFPDASIVQLQRYRGERVAAVSGKPEGSVVVAIVSFGDGSRLQLLNGGPQFPLSDAVSLVVPCADQAEIDRLWERLGDGGRYSQCGWLTDRFGVSWQIVPDDDDLFDDSDPVRAARVMDALLDMSKLDIAALRAAYDGHE